MLICECPAKEVEDPAKEVEDPAKEVEDCDCLIVGRSNVNDLS